MELLQAGQSNGQNTAEGEHFSFPSFCFRLLNFGVSYSDLERIRSVSVDWVTFSRALGELAKQWKRSAEAAWKLGRVETPREQWKRAADYFHYSQLRLPDSFLKATFRRASRTCYERAAGLFDPPAIECRIPFRSAHIAGYLRIRRPGAPCVILIGGLDSAKEVELHYFADVFLRRSCSVFYCDGLGEGELSRRAPLGPEFEDVISAIIDFLRNHAAVGVTPIGCFGIDLGGHLACRAAACDSRIDACISVGGFFDSAVLHRWPAADHEKFLRAFGFREEDDVASLAHYLDLGPLEGRMKAPLLVVHGTSDHLVDATQVKALQQWACGPVDTLMFEGAEHLSCKRFNECLPMLGDWMTNWLLHKNRQEVALI